MSSHPLKDPNRNHKNADSDNKDPNSNQSSNHQSSDQSSEQATASLFAHLWQYLPKLPLWLRHYQTSQLSADMVAGLIVGMLVIPQSLGYAVLAGLPPEYGLYASIVPVICYAWIGSSNVMAVGSVAVMAIMTANGLADFADRGISVYASMASLLAIMVGGLLWVAGWLKMGWIMQFISRGVSTGFVSGAAVLIFISQLKYLTGVEIVGSNVLQALSSLYQHHQQWHGLTSLLGICALGLLLVNRYASGYLWHTWLSKNTAKWMERLFPLLLVVAYIVLSVSYDWATLGVKVIANIPDGLPKFSLPYIPSVTEVIQLLPTAGLMALIAFVSSSSVASFYARQSNETFDANRELKGLGVANFFGGWFQGFAVAGGFSRTAINVDSGAKSPLASLVTVLVMLAALLFLGQLLSPLPYAVLGATIMASIIKLIDYQTFLQAWRVDKLDAISLITTFVAVLLFGLNAGLVVGLLVSFASLIWQSSHPHIAIVGVLEGSEHFRNINRHDVQTFAALLIIRIDESLFFGNSVAVHDAIYRAMQAHPNANDLVLMMSAVNHIDLTAQEMLIRLNTELVADNKRLHYSVIKGPVMDIIAKTEVIQGLSGQVFLSTIEAVRTLKQPTEHIL